MVSVMLIVGAMSSSAQKYCYKYVCTVDENGVKRKDRDPVGYYYIVFSDNKREIRQIYPDEYEDRSNVKESIYYYQGDKNGLHIYNLSPDGKSNSFWYFNFDYSRANSFVDMSKFSWAKSYTYVYEKAEEGTNSIIFY